MKFNVVTKQQMGLIDNLMVKSQGIDILMMMELAGLDVALLAAKTSQGKKIAVLCGKGNNGGDGIAAARHLTNFGFECTLIFPFAATVLRKEPGKQFSIARKMKIKNVYYPTEKEKCIRAIKHSALIIDALLGYNLKGNPRKHFANLIDVANNSKKEILSIDNPSGLDASTGKDYKPCILASKTISLSTPKKGLLTANGKKFAGKIFVGYMSVPKEVYMKSNLKQVTWNHRNLVEPL